MKSKILFFVMCGIILSIPEILHSQEAVSRIKSDFEQGIISSRDYAVYRGYAQFAPDRLDRRYVFTGDQPEKCALEVIDLILREYDNLTPEEQGYFNRYVLRPSLPQTYTSPQGLFKVHYTLSGANGVENVDENSNGIPDFIDEVAAAFDGAHLFYTESLGYLVPPADGIDGNEYDVYVEDLGEAIYGFMNPAGGAFGSSYIVIDNDFLGSLLHTKGLDAMRVTAAHEYHHAVQVGYVWRSQDIYFYEITSTWFEDVLYDDVNDYYGYLQELFQGDRTVPNATSNFRRPFTTVGNQMYGMSLWMHFLEGKYGSVTTHSMVRKMWEEMPNRSAINSIEMVIVNETSDTFEESLQSFYTWNYFTGSRADTVNYYNEGKQYPELVFNDVMSDIGDTTFVIENRKLSSRYIAVSKNFRSTFDLTVTAETADSDQWQVTTILSDGISIPSLKPVVFIDGVNGSSIVTSSGNNPMLVIVATVTNKFDKSGNYPLIIGLKIKGVADLVVSKLLPTIPSPANFVDNSQVRIPFFLVEPSEIEIRIYSLGGALVKKFRKKIYYNAGLYENDIVWDGRDDNDKLVPSGIYVYVLKGDNFIHREKMAIIR